MPCEGQRTGHVCLRQSASVARFLEDLLDVGHGFSLLLPSVADCSSGVNATSGSEMRKKKLAGPLPHCTWPATVWSTGGDMDDRVFGAMVLVMAILMAATMAILVVADLQTEFHMTTELAR